MTRRNRPHTRDRLDGSPRRRRIHPVRSTDRKRPGSAEPTPGTRGHVTVGGLDKDVSFVDVDADDPINDELDAAYRSKYRRYTGPVASITSQLARSATLKLVPQQHN